MTSLNRSYAKGELPADDDPRWEHWRKRPAVVRMMPLRGPCRIVTVDAPTDLPEGWEGWLAIDAQGHPYPLHKDVQAVMYDPAPSPPDPLGYCMWCKEVFPLSSMPDHVAAQHSSDKGK